MNLPIKTPNVSYVSLFSTSSCAESDQTTIMATTTTTTTTTTTITVENAHPEAEIPSIYYDMKTRLNDDGKESDSDAMYHGMIGVYKECIENKVINWRNNANLVYHCFCLHKLFWSKYGIITTQYISFLTHILSNSSSNKHRMDYVISNLEEAGMMNILSLEALISSCYNKDTGDCFLAYYIYIKFRRKYRIIANQNIINELLVSCIKRGAIELAFKIYFELKTDKIYINKQCILKLYDICALKQSLYYADMLTKHLLDTEHRSLVINNYLRICGVSGNVLKALEAIKQFEARDGVKMDLVSVHLLLRTLTTNAEIYAKHKDKWSGILSRKYRENAMENKVHNPEWIQVLSTSNVVPLLTNYQHLFDSNIGNEYLCKLFDRLSFFASRFIENKGDFYAVYKYIYTQKGKYLCNSSIVGHLLRGFRRHKLLTECIPLWQIYWRSQSHIDYHKVEHPYSEMLKICSYNISRDEFRSLGSQICYRLATHYNYFDSQKLFDAAFNFWSGNDAIQCNFLDIQETKTMPFIRTQDTYCALLRCAQKNHNLQRTLQYLSEIQQIPLVNIKESLIRVVFNTYYNFKLCDESLDLLRHCIHDGDSKYLRNNGVFCVIKTYISCGKYEEILNIILSKERQRFWIKQRLINNDDITLLMYCCYKLNNLDLALDLFQISIDCRITKYNTVTYNYFIQVLIHKFGAFSDIVMDTVSHFINDNILYHDYTHTNIINIYQMSSQIVPIIIHCFISKYIQQSIHQFNIVCYKHFWKDNKTFTRDNYRLLFGEDSDYLLSSAHYHLQNYYYPPIKCKWSQGHDEIHCDLTNFINSVKNVT